MLNYLMLTLKNKTSKTQIELFITKGKISKFGTFLLKIKIKRKRGTVFFFKKKINLKHLV